MTPSPLSLATLVGSRICHDLISPVGAINNGLELIAMSGPIDSPEMALISDSVANATARIKFFRVAFGMASPEQTLGAPEVAGIVRDAYHEGRHRAEWRATGDVPRAEVQAGFLAILCAETALPRGGTIALSRDQGNGFVVIAEGDRVNCDAPFWLDLTARRVAADLRPAQVQFALLALALDEMGRDLQLDSGETSLRMAF